MNEQLKNHASLKDILVAAKLYLDFIEGMNQEDFKKDLKTLSAVTHQTLIIGEASKRISDEF